MTFDKSQTKEHLSIKKFWTFMAIDRSHFSAKLRPVVRYKQMHYVEIPPDAELIQSHTGVMFVPVLISPEGEMFQDTTDIIDMLEEQFPESPILPSNLLDLAVCRLFELYADEFFPIVSMRTRWAIEENERECRRAFAAFTGSVEAGDMVADAMKSYLPMLGVTDSTIPAIDAHTKEMLEALDAHFREHRYLLGNRLSLADCALLGPLYAHLYLDRVTRQQLYDTAPHVCMWIERCNRPVPDAMQQWFDGDYPETLEKVLTLIGDDAGTLLSDQCAAFSAWAETADLAAIIPRATTQYQSSLRNVSFEAGVRGYVSWKMQRLIDVIESAPDSDRDIIQNRLARYHCERLIETAKIPRLKKENFELIFDEQNFDS